MLNKTSRLTDKIMLAALLSVATACGSVTQEFAQSKAVRDRSRVLGLALMDDGTYQFRLCRLHKTYTAEILANDCINPLINEDGTERVFNNVPEKPGTFLAKIRNWVTAALAGTIVGVVIYKIGRFFVKTKGGDRIVGKMRLAKHEAKVGGAKASNDFELVERLAREIDEGSPVVGGKDFSNAIAFVENYSQKVEGNVKIAREKIQSALDKSLLVDLDEMQRSLQEASEALQSEASGFRISKDLTQQVEALAKQANELDNVVTKKLEDTLRKMEEEAHTIYKRVHGKEGVRLHFVAEEKKALFAVAEEEDSAVAQILREWKHNEAELSLLDGSDELKKVFLNLKDSKDELVEKLLRIDDVAMKNDPDHLGQGEKTVLQLRQDEKKYRALKDSKQQKDSNASAKLDETEAALKERIKSYNPVQRETEIKSYQEKISAAIKADPVIERGEEAMAQAKAAQGGGEGLLAKGLGKVGNGIKGKVKFLRGFPWVGEDTLKYGNLNKITITDEDKIVAKLAHGVEVKNIEVQQGAEKLAAQVAGISAFLSLPLTEWSRYLPAHALLSAEKNWTEVTGGYASAKRIDDMLTILDGIAQATDSKVSQAALTFGM